MISKIAKKQKQEFFYAFTERETSNSYIIPDYLYDRTWTSLSSAVIKHPILSHMEWIRLLSIQFDIERRIAKSPASAEIPSSLELANVAV
jgi:hypothetical protein